MTRGQKSRVLRVVKGMNNLFAILSAEMKNISRDCQSNVPICFVVSKMSLCSVHPAVCSSHLGCDVDAVLNVPDANRVVPSTTVKGIC